jgi:hypothetical protein
VIAASLVGVIEDMNCQSEASNLGYKTADSPERQKVHRNISAKRQWLVERRGVDRRLVDAGDRDGAALPGAAWMVVMASSHGWGMAEDSTSLMTTMLYRSGRFSFRRHCGARRRR